MRKIQSTRILSAALFAAAFIGMLPGSASAQMGATLSVSEFTLMGDGCPAQESVTIMIANPTATSAGNINISFPNEMDRFSVSGAEAQRSCMVGINVRVNGVRSTITIARGTANVEFSGGEQGVLSLTSRVMVGRRQSAPATLRVNAGGAASSADLPDGVSALSIERINTNADLRGEGRLAFDLSAQTSGASPGAMLIIRDVNFVFSSQADVAG